MLVVLVEGFVVLIFFKLWRARGSSAEKLQFCNYDLFNFSTHKLRV